MKAAVPISKDDVSELLINDQEVICVDKNCRYFTRSVNDMTFPQVKFFLNDPDMQFYKVIEVNK